MTHRVTRKERVIVKATWLLKDWETIKKFNRQKKRITSMGMKLNPLIPGDTYKITYTFDLDYLSGVEKRIDNLTKIISANEPDKIIVKEIIQGKILIKRLFEKIEKLRILVEAKK